MDFNYFLPVNLIFGRGKVRETGSIAAGLGKRALVVTGRNSTKKSGLLDKITKSLLEAGVSSVLYDQVSQNPLTETAVKAAELARAEKCDIVIGAGGGSIMDCAKAAAFLGVNDEDINDYIYNKKKSDRALPIVLIPTTCGTGSEGNGFAVLTNPETGDKKSLRCNAIVASASIIDSECMETMPDSILACVGFDALCHCMEAYVSRIGQPFTDMMSMYGMKLIGKNLVPLFEGDRTAERWDAMSFASTLGGMVINTAGVTLPHGMEHPASGLKNIVHGKGLAALTPVVTEASICGAPEKYAEISACIGGKDETDCVSSIIKLLEKLKLRTSLSELGISGEDTEWMADNCMKVSAAGVNYHPVVFTRNEIAELYRKAL